MDRDKVERLLDDAVAGLSDDPELRLDVRRELLVHVEDAMSAQPEGPDLERLEGALKALGPVEGMAGALVDGNRRRMRWRGWARLMLARAAVPLAVVVALGVAVEAALRSGAIARMAGNNFAGSEGNLVRGLPEEDAFLILGDTTRESAAERQKAIWERYPDRMMFFGNYVTEVLSREAGEGGEARVEEVLRQGMALEPDNARYPFQLAYRLLERSVNWHDPSGYDEPHDPADPEVTDWEGVDEALRLLAAAADSLRYQRYTREVVEHRLEILPDPESMHGQLVQMSYLVAILLPDAKGMLGLKRRMSDLAEVLTEAGRSEDAVRLLSWWEPFCRLFRPDAFTLIDALVLASWIEAGQGVVAPALESMGRPEEAERIRGMTARWGEPFRRFKERQKQSDGAMDLLMERQGGVLAKLLLPALGQGVDPRELEPGRRLEFALVEQVWSGLLMLVLLVLMMGALGVWGRWRHAAGAASAPILLIPRGRQAAVVFAAGVAAPVLAYFLFSQVPFLGGREFGISYLPHRFAAEFLLLGLTVGALTGWLASRFVRRRCIEIGVEAPPATPWGGRVLAGLLVLGWVLCPMTRGVTREFPSWGSTALAVAGLAAAAALVLAVVRGAGMLRADPRHGLYLGTWGRTLAPVYATSILLLALLTQPLLRHQEKVYVQRDTLLALDDQAGFTRIEMQVTRDLLHDLDKAWTQPANEP